MGYDISLVDDSGISVNVQPHYAGGYTIPGGNTKADISITYNYSRYFYCTIDGKTGIRWLYDRPASYCIERLSRSIDMLGTDKDDDYWKPTAGNAGWVLAILLSWAKKNPTATFIGD